VLLLSFAFGGFEAALIPAAEARDPRRDAPFALFTALGVCALVYTLVQVAVVGLLPDAAHAARPVAAAAEAFLGSWGGGFVALGALISVYGYLAANTVTTPRLTYALAESGDMPAFFARVSPRFRTPYVSILVYAVLVWALAVGGNFKWNATLSAVARLFAYSLVCAAMLQMRRRTARAGEDHAARLTLPAGWLFAGVGIVYCLVLVTRMGQAELIIMAITFAVALSNWLWARGRTATPA
jgi:amino acid transporter